MINEVAFSTLLMLAAMVMAGMEMPVKPYLDKAFKPYPQYTQYRPYVLRGVAILLSLAAVLATDGASIMAVFDKHPVGNIGELTDLIITGVAVSFGDQGLHNLYDFARLYLGREAIDAKKTV